MTDRVITPESRKQFYDNVLAGIMADSGMTKEEAVEALEEFGRNPPKVWLDIIAMLERVANSVEVSDDDDRN